MICCLLNLPWATSERSSCMEIATTSLNFEAMKTEPTPMRWRSLNESATLCYYLAMKYLSMILTARKYVSSVDLFITLNTCTIQSTIDERCFWEMQWPAKQFVIFYNVLSTESEVDWDSWLLHLFSVCLSRWGCCCCEDLTGLSEYLFFTDTFTVFVGSRTTLELYLSSFMLSSASKILFYRFWGAANISSRVLSF